MSTIYGVDTTQPYTAKDVLGAIEQCFIEAHAAVLNKDLHEFSQAMSQQDFDKLKQMNVHQLIKNVYKDIGKDYNKPDKESLIQVCNQLADIAKQFRSPEIINQHYGEIMQLVEGLGVED